MSQDIHGFSVSAATLHQAATSGVAFAAQATEAPAPSAGADGKTTPAASGDMSQMIMFIGIMVVMMYVVVLRPQKREKKERQLRLDGMKKGDKVISIGGIHGKITDVDHTQGIVSVEVAPKITVKFSKAAIQAVTPKGEDKEATKQDSDSAKTE
ncbi:TPA: preprotein translocase subunit YajC [Candidatus Sumerlaeota bacterium]|jgi:preprotein translocase subunit YajC|nr:preprotein translocase subunit YajC [Candidatus Sumerlaeota bacterium]